MAEGPSARQRSWDILGTLPMVEPASGTMGCGVQDCQRFAVVSVDLFNARIGYHHLRPFGDGQFRT